MVQTEYHLNIERERIKGSVPGVSRDSSFKGSVPGISRDSSFKGSVPGISRDSSFKNAEKTLID